MGNGTAIVQPRANAVAESATAQAPWAVGGGTQVGAGVYDVALTFDVPRAQIVEWTVACPGTVQSGTSGESFATYRERRIAELREQQRRDRERAAAVGSAVVGAFAPRATAPGVRAEVGVNANAAGEAIANSAVPDVVLSPDDVGAARIGANVQLTTTAAGACVVTAVADDATVLGTYRVTRIRDLHEEQRAANSEAIAVRTQVKARLVAHGADAALYEQQRAAAVEAQRAQIAAEFERKARIQAEIDAKARLQADLEAQWRVMALEARAELRQRCEGHGAEPDRRARVAMEQRVAQEADVRLRADLEQRRLEVALTARVSLRDRWQRFGAVARPPMPAVLDETPGDAPFAGAVWVAGVWEWIAGSWQWQAGGWTDPDVFTAVGGDVRVVEAEGTYLGSGVVDDILSAPVDMDMPTRDRPRPSTDTRQIRDHRTTVRDHRRDAQPAWTPTKSDPPPRESRSDRVEDRNNGRDDKKDDDDRGGRLIRDHRR